MRWPESPGRWRAARSGASPLPMRRLASIQCSSQLSQRGKAGRLPRVDLERSLELLDRAQHHPLLSVDAPQVHVREVPWLIARSHLGILQPLDRLVELPLLDEVGRCRCVSRRTRITPSPLYLRFNATSSFKSCSGGAGFLNAETEGYTVRP